METVKIDGKKVKDFLLVVEESIPIPTITPSTMMTPTPLPPAPSPSTLSPSTMMTPTPLPPAPSPSTSPSTMMTPLVSPPILYKPTVVDFGANSVGNNYQIYLEWSSVSGARWYRVYINGFSEPATNRSDSTGYSFGTNTVWGLTVSVSVTACNDWGCTSFSNTEIVNLSSPSPSMGFQ